MAHSAEIDSKEAWGGGRSPFNLSYGKIFMWFFLVSDALTFGGLLISYGFIRHKYAEVWPKAEHVFTHFPFVEQHIPLAYVGLMTFILIMSSVTMVLAVEAGHRMDRKGVITWMFWTIVGGAAFVGSQAWEWYHFIIGTDDGALRNVWDPATNAYVKQIWHGANMTVNEYGVPQFANYFFFITGFHGTHVFSGVVINFIIFLNVIKGTYERRGHYEMVEKVGLYWHFVDLVWVFVFTFFYLL
ncbi:cytochrome c oxidase subunit 3 [Aurantibacillus circumpalustris]|uniref:cytochrome c oxidase subunit 3 n=1 Tax=Aurantibacillus circumpalustris TaxID=3036359 RepID=UPI00295BD2F6|nr:cytochrome c oxidase subunit 3 [Aurantibacillus circumpalustris]